MEKQRGFTLVELVVVIVILGLLAAAALPKFINVTQDARIASVNGVSGGLQSAVALARAQYVVDNNPDLLAVTMDGQSVETLDETTYSGRGGRPTCGGIRIAMDPPQGYDVTPAACTSVGDAVTFAPTGIDPTTTNCFVTYDPDGIGVNAFNIQTGGC